MTIRTSQQHCRTGSAFPRWGTALILAVSALSFCEAKAADALRIGVAYVPPAPGVSDTRLYTEEGFEIDLAKELARRLQRPLELVRVPDGEWQGALEGGRIDLAVGSISSEPSTGLRRFEAGVPAGLSVAMRSDTAIRSWRDLRGRIVCVAEANGRAKALAALLGATVREERAPARSLMRVRTGECDAALHEKLLLDALFLEKNWQKFSATLPPVEPASLVVTAGPAMDGETLGTVGDTVAAFNTQENQQRRFHRWAANVAFEVYLDQEAPDCHS